LLVINDVVRAEQSVLTSTSAKFWVLQIEVRRKNIKKAIFEVEGFFSYEWVIPQML
jgi:hypothetical protein